MEIIKVCVQLFEFVKTVPSRFRDYTTKQPLPGNKMNQPTKNVQPKLRQAAKPAPQSPIPSAPALKTETKPVQKPSVHDLSNIESRLQNAEKIANIAKYDFKKAKIEAEEAKKAALKAQTDAEKAKADYEETKKKLESLCAELEKLRSSKSEVLIEEKTKDCAETTEIKPSETHNDGFEVKQLEQQLKDAKEESIKISEYEKKADECLKQARLQERQKNEEVEKSQKNVSERINDVEKIRNEMSEIKDLVDLISAKVDEFKTQNFYVNQKICFEFSSKEKTFKVEKLEILRGQQLLKESEYVKKSVEGSGFAFELVHKQPEERDYSFKVTIVYKDRRFVSSKNFASVKNDPGVLEELRLLDALNKIPVVNAGRAGRNIEKQLDFLNAFKSFSRIELKTCSIVDQDFGLSIEENNLLATVRGVPKKSGIVNVVIEYSVTKCTGAEIGKKEIPLLDIKKDPRDLWNNIPSDPNGKYAAPDEDSTILPADVNMLKTIVAASKRGRSHAQKGSYRDDNFKVGYLKNSGWYIVVVSDGAGSAEFSRKGSELVCNAFLNKAESFLTRKDIAFNIDIAAKIASGTITNEYFDTPEFKSAFDAVKAEFPNATNRCADTEPSLVVENYAKQIVWGSGYSGYMEIFNEARTANVEMKKYAATLLGFIMKRIGDKWFIASINVGDGIIGLVDCENNVKTLAKPDGGENVGETRFVTMPSIWGLKSDNTMDQERLKTEQGKRLFTEWVSDFKCIMSMTDGVSDPKFGTDDNLGNSKYWLDLWNELSSTISLEQRNESTSKALLDWLDFYEEGHHDDRTIAVVY